MHKFPNNTKHDTVVQTESDSHADTNCSRKNMTLLSYTVYEFNVISFHSGIKSMEKIPVVTEVTVYDDPPEGNTFILVFNKELWFGVSVVKSLIATNKVRSNGLQLSDNPYDQNRPLGIVNDALDWYIRL